MNLFAERFLPLIEKSGKTDQELEKAMGLPRSIIYDWKNGRNKSSFKKYAGNFAEYFNVSADYLLGNTVTRKAFALIWIHNFPKLCKSTLSSLVIKRNLH